LAVAVIDPRSVTRHLILTAVHFLLAAVDSIRAVGLLSPRLATASIQARCPQAKRRQKPPMGDVKSKSNCH
jgi:hypothetical protein